MERNGVQGPLNKIWWKTVFCQIYAIFGEKMVNVVIDRYFTVFLKGFEDFSLAKAITDSHFKRHRDYYVYEDFCDEGLDQSPKITNLSPILIELERFSVFMVFGLRCWWRTIVEWIGMDCCHVISDCGVHRFGGGCCVV